MTQPKKEKVPTATAHITKRQLTTNPKPRKNSTISQSNPQNNQQVTKATIPVGIGMEGSSIAVAAAAAFALSAGCSLLLFFLPCDKTATAARSSFSKPIHPCIRTNSSTSTVKGGARKQVRFVGVEDGDSNQNKKMVKKAAAAARKSPGGRKQRGSVPENWRRLYCGINRYRSQQAALLMYA
ncbi:uncharacterized protein LOC127263845 [Andrographis paniculata]|uniref:uncharacterized protein LOC127263845 n=1 Tax=Andrographis paniculata TaxID=175694 RepID=UPI0021E86317|nr:uncharacterized protein LOC127263845 [Andrographis paniculata]